MVIIVNDAEGFVGANIVKALSERGEANIVAVDNLLRADKVRNAVNCETSDYLDKTDFIGRLRHRGFSRERAIFTRGLARTRWRRMVAT